MKNLLHIFTFILMVAPISALAQFSKDPVKKGMEIADAMDKLDTGFKDQKANMKMVLRDRNGRESVRVIRNSSLEVKGDGDKALISFDEPRTVKGTRFLSFTHKKGSDDQWLYLPKLKRVKRIASNNKSGPFMGSEFAYEDISSQEVEKYTYKYLHDEKVKGVEAHVLERYPVDKKSGYTKQIAWIAKGEGNYRVLKVDFYDIKKSHLKTLEYEGYKKYLDRFWRPNVMKMVNHVTKKSTDLVWDKYEFKTGLTSRDFDKNALKR